MFVALSLIAGLLPTLPGSFLKFGGFPLLLAGLLVGPRTGFALGCLTDIMVFVLRPPGMFFPGFTLTQGLTAMLPGLLTRGKEPLTGWSVKEKGLVLDGFSQGKAFLRLLVIFGITQLITSVLLVYYFTYEYGVLQRLELGVAQRTLNQSIHVPIYAAMAVAVLAELSQTESYLSLLRARR